MEVCSVPSFVQNICKQGHGRFEFPNPFACSDTLSIYVWCSVGTILQYYRHYAILGFAIFIITSIVNIASPYMSVFLE